ncbi:MAG: hypothetical protein HY080_13060 [Gammaproteobacteria bacterium]|nr:hypothetical protein [Gammaproteobacteria bacterium]
MGTRCKYSPRQLVPDVVYLAHPCALCLPPTVTRTEQPRHYQRDNLAWIASDLDKKFTRRLEIRL